MFKKATTTLFIFIFCFHSSYAQVNCTSLPSGETCPSVGDPYIGDCFAGIERYLARSIMLSDVVSFNTPSGHWSPCDDPVFTNTTHGLPNSLACGGDKGYSPDRYCEFINLSVQLKAAMLLSVAGGWNRDLYMATGSDYYNAAKQAVIDINTAYDCAGLRRPIIGATMLEHVDELVNNVEIPTHVINAFAQEINESGNSDHYNNGPVNFTHSNIVASGTSTPHIAKLEAQMYFYYLATQFIDLGYKCFIPDYVNWSIKIGHDPTLDNTYNVLSKVRAYAAANNTFVIFSTYNSYTKTTHNVHGFLFDFKSGAARPHESANLSVCAGSINTVILPTAPYGSEIMHEKYGGVGVYNNCDYGYAAHSPENRVPFNIGFDWHSGTCYDGPGGPASQYTDPSCVWGYDEAMWFYALSDDNCRVEWLRYAFYETRNISHRGFFFMPGISALKNGFINVGTPSFPSYTPLYPSYGVNTNGHGYLTEQQPLIDLIQNDLWAVHENPSFTLTNLCVNSLSVAFVEVDNPEPSTVYTWHVQDLVTGAWQDYTYGKNRAIVFANQNQHKVGLRCDNWGYQTYTNGTLTHDQFPYPLSCGSNKGNPNGTTPYDKAALQATLDSLSANDIDIVDYFKELSKTNPNISVGTPIKYEYQPTSITHVQNNKIEGSIYPNPAINSVNIKLINTKDFQGSVEIYTPTGQQVLVTKNIKSDNQRIKNIDISHLTSGIYYIRLKSENGQTIYVDKISVLK